MSDLDTAASCQVLVEVEFLLKFQNLVPCVGRSGPFAIQATHVTIIFKILEKVTLRIYIYREFPRFTFDIRENSSIDGNFKFKVNIIFVFSSNLNEEIIK